MVTKGERTKKNIVESARVLFAEYGFHAVTMKDICDSTGLSRGGLYRHYGSTDAIFEELFQELSQSNIDCFHKKMEEGVSAVLILTEALAELEEEMSDELASLSLAIYEYAATKNNHFFEELNTLGRRKWETLIQYGVRRGEFRNIDPRPVIDLLLYSYQGVRLWSRIITIAREDTHRMLEKVKELLVDDNHLSGEE